MKNEFAGIKSLSLNHLLSSSVAAEAQAFVNQGMTNARQILWHIENKTAAPPTCVCGKPLQWHPDQRQYRQYCSVKCSTKHSVSKRSETNLKRYGVEHSSQRPEWKALVAATSQARYGVDHPGQSAVVQERRAKTNLERYGAEHPMQNPEVQERVKATVSERYGPSVWADPEIARKRQASWDLHYNGNPGRCQAVRARSQATSRQRYGVDYPAQDPAVQERIVQTRRLNHHGAATLTLLEDREWLASQNRDGRTVGEIAEQIGVSASQLGKIFAQHGIEIARHSRTVAERAIQAVLDGQGISYTVGDRAVLAGREIDILIPGAGLGIEINGSYWHTEEFGKDSQYHLSKTAKASAAGIELWHFWDYEVAEKKTIVVSKILQRLGVSARLGARECWIAPVTHSEKRAFFEQTHIQGDAASAVNLGLFHSDQLVACMSFGASRFYKGANWELIRYATRLNTTVVGGASRLFSTFRREHSGSVVSYCNRRFSKGNLYRQLGFEEVGLSSPGYCYFKRGEYAGSRNQWQKHMLSKKLAAFDPALTEVKNMAAHGYYRGWDCGNFVFLLK